MVYKPSIAQKMKFEKGPINHRNNLKMKFGIGTIVIGIVQSSKLESVLIVIDIHSKLNMGRGLTTIHIFQRLKITK